MNKVLLIDTAIDGHHMAYLKGILTLQNNFVVVIPKSNFNCESKVIYTDKFNLLSFNEYKKWLKELNKIIDFEKPDVVHFLYGDVFYRYFGYGLSKIKKKCNQVVVTFHQFRIKSLVRISLKRIFKKISIGIIHTEYNRKELELLGIKNAKVIDYPQLYDFETNSNNSNDLKNHISVESNTIILSLIGTLMSYKGLDILIEALKKVNKSNYKVIIAGKLYNNTEVEIQNMLEPIKDKVIFKPGFIPDETFIELINGSNYILLPYKKGFDGASGPLTEAVWARKPVIASDNKALGDITKKYNLGYTFECENSDDLAKTIENAIDNKFKWNDKAEDFRNKINLNTFLSEIDKIYNNE